MLMGPTGFLRIVRVLLASWALFGLALGCSNENDSTTDALEAYCPIDSAEVEARIDELLQTLTLEEKASLMHGVFVLPVDGTWQSTSIPEKGVPGFHMLDGPKGVGGSSSLSVANGAKTTAFPVALARSASWSPELEERVGTAIAEEARAVGADTLLAPGMNIVWHPLSGRNQEYYGEDPFLAGEIGLGFVRGVQGKGVIATAKHFTANHIEDTRLDVNVNIDERTLRENFLPQFRKLVQQGGVASVMSAYNQLNGTYCSENSVLLGEILKEEWGFAGYVVSDFLWGTHHTVPAALAGLDVEMQIASIYGSPVVEAVQRGDLDAGNVDEHVRRILRAQLCYELDSNPPAVDESKLETAATLALAREVATRSIVLLRNEDDLLPLSKTKPGSILLLGPLANLENIGDRDGSSGVSSSEVVTIAEGLLARTDVAASIEQLPGELNEPEEQLQVSAADLVIVALGLTEEDEGEGQTRPPAPALGAGDRDSYGLPAEQLTFLSRVLTLNRNVIVLLEGGSAIDMSPWFVDARAVLMAWYPGAQGGHAIADLLFGDANPSGRLPVSFPARIEDLQAFPGSELEVTYERYHGYQRLDKNAVPPFLPFGFGLSYTSFEYEGLTVEPRSDAGRDWLEVAVDLRNAGSREGLETVQVYAGALSPSVDQPVRKLVGFKQVSLRAGESQRVEIEVPVSELAYFDVGEGWVLDPGTYRIELGSNVATLPVSADLELP
jgi:beta-glucosidase